MDNDVEEFENDRLRVDLSNLLSAIALLSLPSGVIAHSLQDTPGT